MLELDPQTEEDASERQVHTKDLQHDEYRAVRERKDGAGRKFVEGVWDSWAHKAHAIEPLQERRGLRVPRELYVLNCGFDGDGQSAKDNA